MRRFWLVVPSNAFVNVVRFQFSGWGWPAPVTLRCQESKNHDPFFPRHEVRLSFGGTDTRRLHK
jgi:hypothetical protein